MREIKIFSGNSNPLLAEKIASHLQIPLGNAIVGRFSDGEIMVEVLENVRGRDTFILQSTSAPANDNLMELIILADALRRASASSITAVMPYFGYARQDRRVRSARVPITAKVVADMMASVGITRLITVDLHADQIQGFFYMPVDNVYSTPVMLDDMAKKVFPSPTVVSPDVGGVVRARAVAKRLNDSDLAIIDKRRPSHNQAEVMHIIGDVGGKNCIIVDDMVDTAGTLTHAATALKENGAATVTAYCTHPIFSGSAIENIESSALDEVVVSDTIPLTEKARGCHKIRQLGLSHIIAETIYRVNHKESVSSLFVD
ncbi:MAG: ribose-phosphate pyrophosphokinase [Gammaproteobacteria bacterium]|nr:ribose-phosphate pyrophosphokinase [Gammaproteobacteria bacterium]